MKKKVLEKIPLEKSPPDSKLNPIPNLTLTLPLTRHRVTGAFFRGGGGFLTPSRIVQKKYQCSAKTKVSKVDGERSPLNEFFSVNILYRNSVTLEADSS